jgi:hypothetical protein
MDMFGLRIMESPHLTVTEEDWSRVRSPGRARRRRARGFRQNIAYVTRPDPNVYFIGKDVVGHPAIVAQIRNLAL